MFRNCVTDTPLTTDIANSFFQNISGQAFNSDKTFLSTLRALVAPRMNDDESIYLHFTSSNYTESQVSGNSVSTMMDAILSNIYLNDAGVIHIHNLNSRRQEDNIACMELLKSSFMDRNIGWHRLEKVTDFYRKQFYSLCFINPDLKSVVVFVESLDMKKMHYLQCSIFAFLPWYFDPQAGVDDIEMELIQSLRENTKDKYLNCIAKIAAKYDFRTIKIKQLLGGFETKYEKVECERLKNETLDIINRINSLNADIASYFRTKNDYEIRISGLEKKIAEGGEGSEIMDYFLCNNKLSLDSVTDDEMRFVVKDYITYFDEDLAERMINSRTSTIYTSSTSSISDEDMKKLMHSVFIDQNLKIKVCAAYKFNLNGNVYATSNYSFGSEFDDSIPNPHIDGYSCMGGYTNTINELLLDRNYISAIEQCIASAKSLNFSDSTVMGLFMRILHGNDGRNRVCIELPDGTVVNPEGAIKWLNAQEESNG